MVNMYVIYDPHYKKIKTASKVSQLRNKSDQYLILCADLIENSKFLLQTCTCTFVCLLG